MKAKKNLYEAPATEVQNIVNDAVMNAYDWAIEDNGEFNELFIVESVRMVCAFSEWNLPSELMKKVMYGELEFEDFQDEVVTWVTAQYHKSLAA